MLKSNFLISRYLHFLSGFSVDVQDMMSESLVTLQVEQKWSWEFVLISHVAIAYHNQLLHKCNIVSMLIAPLLDGYSYWFHSLWNDNTCRRACMYNRLWSYLLKDQGSFHVKF